MRRRSPFALALLAVVAFAVTSCAPVAQGILPHIERNDDASLVYVEQGLQFDPGSLPAQGAILIIQGSDLALLGVPDGASCTLAGEEIDCRLGNVVAPTTVHLTGRGVVANVSWRRPGSSVVYLIFARAEVEGGG